jgi:hypothetical protein
MKIEIKPCDDRVRFTQPIIFMRIKQRNHVMKAVRRDFAPGPRRKMPVVHNPI